MLVITALFLIAGLAVGIVRARTPRLVDVRNRNYDRFDRDNSAPEYVQHPNGLRHILTYASVGLIALGALFLGLGSFYLQPEGTTMVQRDFTGRIVGQTDEAGFHVKPIWVDGIEYNARNQPIAFGGSEEAFDANRGAGYVFDGPWITVADKDHVSHNVDINVLYSLQPSKVQDIARSFPNEQAFKDNYVFVAIRDVVREVANQFTTEQMLSDRASYRAAIEETLRDRWTHSDLGVQLSELALQEVRSPEGVKTAFETAQQAQINISTEESKLEATKVSAQNKIVQAEAEAEANDILSKSLSNEVLQQRTLDTLKEIGAGGNLIVVPNDFSGILNVPGRTPAAE